MNRIPELVIALDFADAHSALRLAKDCLSLSPRPWLKIGLQLYTAEGPELVKRIKESGFKVFLDLKFYDIPNTVYEAVRASGRLGVDMLNIHLSGGERMAGAAVAAVNELSPKPILLGVTVLTSTPAPESGTVTEQILTLAQQGKDWGLDGVVCSAWEAGAIKRNCGKKFICLTPGIRPEASDKQDQARVMTPEQAVLRGSDFLVVGRPITQSPEPLRIARAISDSIRMSAEPESQHK